MRDTIFDKILNGEIDSYPVWEDGNYLAFLTPFPNTPGSTVVIPKHYQGDYVFDLDDKQYSNLLIATKKVAKLIEKALDAKRVAMVFEGTGVAYVHAKLYPLFGSLASQTDVWVGENEFNEEYRGWITTLEGPGMEKTRLIEIQSKIKDCAVT